MLEQAHLLIQRGEGETVWTIADADTLQPLGLARWRPWTGPPWLAWLARPFLDVFESEDEPLVFSIRRVWALSSKWEVRDAEGRRVALLQRGFLVDAFGQVAATNQKRAAGGPTRFRSSAQELAHATWAADGVRLEFVPELEGYPLVKMALLAAVLIA
jgi:hypothetical protein